MLVLDSVNEIFVHHLELPQNLIVVLYNQKPIYFVGFLLNLLLKFVLSQLMGLLIKLYILTHHYFDFR